MGDDHTPMKHVWLLPIWLASMLFLYQHISPFLNLDLGIRISPDRLLFLVILGLFLKSTSGQRRGGTIERLMLVFAVLCTISWVTTRPDAEGTKLRWLTTIFQLAYFQPPAPKTFRLRRARPEAFAEWCSDYSELSGLYRVG